MSLRKCTFSMPLLVVALLALFSCVSNFVSREEYKVTVDSSIVGGTLKVSSSTFAVGTPVNVEVIPDPGCKMVEGSLFYSMDSRKVTIRKDAFFMPAGDVVITAQFALIDAFAIEYEDTICFQGEMVCEPTIRSNRSDILLKWSSDNEAIVDLALVEGRPLARRFLGITSGKASGRKVGTAKVAVSATGGVTKEITVISLPRYCKINSQGIITDISTDFPGGELRVPSFVDGIEVTGIGYRAFAYKNIESVYLPNTLKKIDKEAFLGNNINQITIPEKVQFINSGAFDGNGLKEVVLSAKSPSQKLVADDAFGKELVSVVVDSESLFEYRMSKVWDKYSDKIISRDTCRINVDDLEFGSLGVQINGLEISNAIPGEEVSVIIRPEATYQYSEGSLRYTGMSSGRNYKIPFDEARGYHFTMPNEAVLLTATFKTRDFALNVTHSGPTDNGKTVSATNKDSEICGRAEVSRNGKSESDYKIVLTPKAGFLVKNLKVCYTSGGKTLFEVYTTRVSDLVYTFTIPQKNSTKDGIIDVKVQWERVILTLVFMADTIVEKVQHSYGSPLPECPISINRISGSIRGKKFSGFYDDLNHGNIYYDKNGSICHPNEPFTPASYGSEVVFYAHFEPITVNMTALNGQPLTVSATNMSEVQNFASGKVETRSVEYGHAYPRMPIPQVPSELAATLKNFKFVGYFINPNDDKTQTHDKYGNPIYNAVCSEENDFLIIGKWVQNEVKVAVEFGLDLKNMPSTNEEKFPSSNTGLAAGFSPGETPPAVAWPIPYHPALRCVGLYDRKNEIGTTNKLGEKYYDVQYENNPANGTGEIVLGTNGSPKGHLVPRKGTQVECDTENNILTLYPAWDFNGVMIKDGISAGALLRNLYAGVHTYGIFKTMSIDAYDNVSAISLHPEKKNPSDKTATDILGTKATTVLRLYIHEGVTLTAKAGVSKGSISGRAGIHVPVGTRLEVYGGGTLIVHGGYTDPVNYGRFGYEYFTDKALDDITHTKEGLGDYSRNDGDFTQTDAWIRIRKLFNYEGKLIGYKTNTTDPWVYVKDGTSDLYKRVLLDSNGNVKFQSDGSDRWDRIPIKASPIPSGFTTPGNSEWSSAKRPSDSSYFDEVATCRDPSLPNFKTKIGPDFSAAKFDKTAVTEAELSHMWLAEDGYTLASNDADREWGTKMDAWKTYKLLAAEEPMLPLGAWGTPGSGAAIGSHGGIGGLSAAAGQQGFPAGEIIISDVVSLELHVYEGLPTHGGMGGGGGNVDNDPDRQGISGGGGGGGGGIGAPIGGGGGGGGGGAWASGNNDGRENKTPAFGGEYGVPSTAMVQEGLQYYGAGGFGGLGGGGNFCGLSTSDHLETPRPKESSRHCDCVSVGKNLCVLEDRSDYAYVYDKLRTSYGAVLHGFADFHGSRGKDIDKTLRSKNFMSTRTNFRVGSYNYLCLRSRKPYQHYTFKNGGDKSPEEILFTQMSDSSPLTSDEFRTHPGMQGSVELIDFSKWIQRGSVESNYNKSKLGQIKIVQHRLVGDSNGLIYWPSSAITTALGDNTMRTVKDVGKARCPHTYTTDAGVIPIQEALILAPSNFLKVKNK